MTDTRKEFGDWIRNFNLDSSSSYYRVAYESWQACQSLNDKRIEQLMAVIAKKDDALIKACELIEKFSLHVYNGSDCLMVYDAVELQPADVELVEVERVRIIDGIPTLCSSKSSSGEPAYTIKTKADKK